MKRFSSIVAVFLVMSAALCAGDWPNWRGPDHNGISRETDWNPMKLNENRLLWDSKVGAGYSSVAVANGRLYTAGNFNRDTDVIRCLEASSGRLIWRHEYPEPLAPKFYSGGCSATPTVLAGKVYMVSKRGWMFCLDADTGKVLWQRKLRFKEPGWGFASSIVILGQAAILNAGASGAAYDKDTGAVLWESANDACGYATPVPFEFRGQTRLAIFAKDALHCVNPSDGQVHWSHPWRTSHSVNAADPIVSAHQVFITSGYGRGASLVDFSRDTPRTVWENKLMRCHMSGPVLVNGFLYGFDDNQLVCLDWNSGERKWIEKSPKKGSLMATKDKLIVIGETGRLAIVETSPTAYKELAAAKVTDGRCWTMPVLANGLLYVRNSEGRLVCLDLRNNKTH